MTTLAETEMGFYNEEDEILCGEVSNYKSEENESEFDEIDIEEINSKSLTHQFVEDKINNMFHVPIQLTSNSCNCILCFPFSGDPDVECSKRLRHLMNIVFS